MLRVLASFFVETYFVHWAHRIEDTDALSVVGYHYLLVFHINERTSVKQSMKRKACSNLADLPPGIGIW